MALVIEEPLAFLCLTRHILPLPQQILQPYLLGTDRIWPFSIGAAGIHHLGQRNSRLTVPVLVLAWPGSPLKPHLSEKPSLSFL